MDRHRDGVPARDLMLFQARRGDREIATRMTTLADDLARLLPPAKRGKRSAAS